MLSSRSAFVLVVVPLLLTGCPKNPLPCDPSREGCGEDTPAAATAVSEPPKTWCDVVGGYMSGFECLTLAGAVSLESFGPERSRISEGTLSACFGGELPSEIPRRTAPAMLPAYSQDFTTQISGQSGISLQKLGGWLPSARIKAGKGSKVSVEISFEELSRTQISDISLGFRSKLLRSSARNTIAKLDSCLRRLCRPEYLAVVEVLSGYPKITITTQGEFEVQGQVGWDTDKVDLGASGSSGTSQTRKITMTREKEASPIVIAARMINLSNSMYYDGLCDPDSYQIATSPDPTSEPIVLASNDPKLEEKGQDDPRATSTTPKVTDPSPETTPVTLKERPAPKEYLPVLASFEEGLKGSVRRLLSGKGDDPKEVKVGKKRFAIGDLLKLSKKEEVILVNEERVSHPNGEELSFGDSCDIEVGGELEMLGFYEGFTPEALVRYKSPKKLWLKGDKGCPDGAMFFYLL